MWLFSKYTQLGYHMKGRGFLCIDERVVMKLMVRKGNCGGGDCIQTVQDRPVQSAVLNTVSSDGNYPH